MEFIAEVTWDNLIMVGAAMGLLGGVQVAREHFGKKTNGEYNRELCDERHKGLDRQHQEMRETIKKIFEKLDALTEHLLK